MARGRAINRTHLIELLNAGLPIEDIAAALKCGASGVYEAARRLGYRQRDGKMVRPARDPVPEPEAPRQDILYEFPAPDASIAEWAKPLSASCESPRGTSYAGFFDAEKGPGGRASLLAQRVRKAMQARNV